MPRLLLLIAGIGILLFGLLIVAILGLGHVLPTKQLIYVAHETDEPALFLLDFYHHLQIELVKDAYSPAWSPDGEQIAFYSTRDRQNDLYIMDVYTRQITRHIQRLGQTQANTSSPSWSPDGREIVFASNFYGILGIYVASVDCIDTFTRCATRLTPKDNYRYFSPAWSPDGKFIALVSDKSRSAKNRSLGSNNIYMMKRDGTDLHRLTENLDGDYFPAWSPDGQHLVYVAKNLQLDQTELMITDSQCSADISCTRLLFSNILNLMLTPSWSPDGTSIVFVDGSSGKYELYTIDHGGRYLQRLTYNDIDETSPRWRP